MRICCKNTEIPFDNCIWFRRMNCCHRYYSYSYAACNRDLRKFDATFRNEWFYLEFWANSYQIHALIGHVDLLNSHRDGDFRVFWKMLERNCDFDTDITYFSDTITFRNQFFHLQWVSNHDSFQRNHFQSEIFTLIKATTIVMTTCRITLFTTMNAFNELHRTLMQCQLANRLFKENATVRTNLEVLEQQHCLFVKLSSYNLYICGYF